MCREIVVLVIVLVLEIAKRKFLALYLMNS
jgi:hypothetical protein